MAIPSKKSTEIEQALENLFGRTTEIVQNKCVTCSKDAIEFEDRLSRREYLISGMCQKCQNSVFGGTS